MKAKDFRWVFLALLAPLLFLGFSPGSKWTIGASAEWSNGNYTFSGGTHPGALLLSGITIVLYLWLLRSKVSEEGRRPTPTVFRRFVAFYIDFIFAMVATAPIFGVIPTLAEWWRTGSFEWTFERTTYFASDGYVIAVSVPLNFVALIFYFAWPLLLQKPSPGACIMGYQILPDEGFKITLMIALGRTALGFVSVCGFYVAPFIERDRERGKYWVDAVFHTHAIQLK